MKLKPFIHKGSGKISLGTTLVDDELRADMFLPAWMLVMGLLVSIFGVAIGIVSAVLHLSVLLIVLAAIMVLLGVAALLCWKNQTIRMLTNDTFEYSTFLGNKTVYRFSDIKGMKKSADATTLYVADRKVHIESIAIVTERLTNRIHHQLEVVNECAGN